MNICFVIEEMTSLSDNISQHVFGESPRYIYALNRAEFIHHKTVFSKDTNIFNNEQTAFLIKQTFLSLRRKIITDHCFQNGHMVTVKYQKYNIKHDRTLTITESFKE